jgi:hypothetical protein
VTSFAEWSGIVGEVEAEGGRTSGRGSAHPSIWTPREWVSLRSARYEKRRRRRRFFTGDIMRTRRHQSVVSVASALSIGLAALLVAALGACAGRQRPVTQTERAGRAETTANATTDEPRSDMLQFDNQATVWVDVYLAWAGRPLQWRLGRVLPGARAMLRVPESAIDPTLGFVQLTVIPGSQMSAEPWRDPRAVIAIAQPISTVLAQCWTFRQPAGLPLQLQSTPLTWRR